MFQDIIPPEFYNALVTMHGISFLTTTGSMRAPGRRMMRLPLMVWMQITAAVIFMTSVGPLIAGALSFMVWAHHMFVSGMNFKLVMPFSITTILISVPFTICFAILRI